MDEKGRKGTYLVVCLRAGDGELGRLGLGKVLCLLEEVAPELDAILGDELEVFVREAKHVRRRHLCTCTRSRYTTCRVGGSVYMRKRS